MIEVAVCDDDVKDLDYAVKLLHGIFANMNIEYSIQPFLSANEMLSGIKKIDIGILDIAMKGLNGIELGRRLKIKFPNVKLIYITGYEEYCMQAINDAHAFSFLCKPLDDHKMQKQIIEALSGISNTVIEKEFYKVMDSQKRKYPSVRLKLEDILYVEYIKGQRKAAIVLENEIYECECVFEKIARELEQYGFLVNSRGNLVNLSHVEKIKGFVVYLDNGKELPIAQKRIVEFREKLNEFLQRNS